MAPARNGPNTEPCVADVTGNWPSRDTLCLACGRQTAFRAALPVSRSVPWFSTAVLTVISSGATGLFLIAKKPSAMAQ